MASTSRISKDTIAPIVVNAEKLWNRLTSSTALLCRSLRNSGRCSCTRSCLLCRGPLCQSMPTGFSDSSPLLLYLTACSCSLCTNSGGFCLRLRACWVAVLSVVVLCKVEGRCICEMTGVWWFCGLFMLRHRS
jgi:hypothetical protein